MDNSPNDNLTKINSNNINNGEVELEKKRDPLWKFQTNDYLNCKILLEISILQWMLQKNEMFL